MADAPHEGRIAKAESNIAWIRIIEAAMVLAMVWGGLQLWRMNGLHIEAKAERAALSVQISAVDAKVDAMDAKVDAMDAKVDALATDVSAIRELLLKGGSE